MLDFSIDITSKTVFDFTDNSDYTGLTVTNTELRIFTPTIASDTFVTVELYSDSYPSLPVGASLGDNATIDLEDLEIDLSLTDGVYRFRYVITLDDLSTQTLDLYVLVDIDTKLCRKNIIKGIINDNASSKCKSCEATIIDSIINSINNELENGNYKSGEELFAYLKKKCNLCTNC